MENNNEEIKNENSLTILDLFNIVIKNWIIILVSTVLITLMGLVFSTKVISPKYSSTAHLLVTVNSDGSGNSSSNIANDTSTAVKMLASVAEIMELNPVLQNVINDLNLQMDIKDFKKAITVTHGTGNASLIITVLVEISDQELVKKVSSSLVENTIDYIKDLQNEGSLKGVELVNLKDASDGVYSSPNVALYVLISFVAGLVLGCFIIFIKELFDTRIKSEKELKLITNKQIVGSLPNIKMNKEDGEIPVIFDNYPTKTAYSKLQSNIKFASIDQNVKSILITSSTSNETKSTVVSNLANQYIETEHSVLIVDLDLRNPTIHKIFNIPNNKGVAEYVSDNLDLDSIIRKTDYNIDIITAGNETIFVDKILSSSKLAELINILKEKYDYILIDSAPLVQTADALIISSYVDGILFVVKMNSTSKKHISKSLGDLSKTNSNVLGVVTTNNKIESSSYYSYYNKNNNK